LVFGKVVFLRGKIYSGLSMFASDRRLLQKNCPKILLISTKRVNKKYLSFAKQQNAANEGDKIHLALSNI